MLGPSPKSPTHSPPAPPRPSPHHLGVFEKAASQLLVILFLSFLWLFEFYFLSFFIFWYFFYCFLCETKRGEGEGEGNKKMKNFAAGTSLRAQLPERGLPLCAEPLSRCLPQPLLLLVDVIKISFSGHRKCHTMAYRYTPHTHTHSHTNSLTAK